MGPRIGRLHLVAKNHISSLILLYFIILFSAKVASISQSGSLSLFSSKEQELEQRALLLKRLAFVIFCSDIDQYQKQMPEIQGKIFSIQYPDFTYCEREVEL